MLQLKARIIYNKRLKDGYFHLAVGAAKVAQAAQAGQFVNIRINNADEPLLRRPFSIHRAGSRTVEMIYEVLGKGTEALSQKKSGEHLDIIGPLGNGFNYQSPSHRDTKSPVLVAGGMGVAPLVFLAERLKKVRSAKCEVRSRVLIGAKTKKQILCEKEFQELGCEVKIATDDGSRGLKGKVTDLLRQELRTPNSELRTIFACGPKPMLQEVARLSAEYNFPAQVSLEEHMACGMGACLGCVIKTRNQKPETRSGFAYRRVCKEGPVFDADEIIWD